MKMSTAKVKRKRPKWLIPALIGGGVVLLIVILIIIGQVKGNKANFYTTLDEFMSVETCNFRYVIDVQSAEHQDKQINLEEYMDDTSFTQSNGENQDDKDLGYKDVSELDSVEEGSHPESTSSTSDGLYGGMINQSWGTAEGTVTADWNYPNFEVILSGRVESTSPLSGFLNIRIATQYTSSDFVNMIFSDNKTYIDLKTLRAWLLGAKDTRLVSLAENLPDNIYWLEVPDEDFAIPTVYAESGEENSGAETPVEWYRRLLILEKIISNHINKNMGSTGLTSDKNKSTLSLTGDSAQQLFSVIKSLLNTSAGAYDTWVSNLDNNGIASKDRVSQLRAEKDNFLSAMTDKWVSLNKMTGEDIKALNLNVIGKSNKYSASTGGSVIEVNLGTAFTNVNTDYVITVYGCKQDLSVESTLKDLSRLHKQGISDGDISTFDNISKDTISAVYTYLRYYFRLLADKSSYSLTSSQEVIMNNLLSNFVDLVNETNESLNGGIEHQDIYTIEDYIKRFDSMDESQANSNEVIKANVQLVKDFKEQLYSLFGKDGSSEANSDDSGSEQVNIKPEDRLIAFSNSSYAVEGSLNTCKSNNNLTVIDIKIRQGEVAKTIDLSKWYAKDSKNNKYPINYKAVLGGLGVSDSDIVSEVDFSQSSEVEAKLYIVVSDTTAIDIYNESDELIANF